MIQQNIYPDEENSEIQLIKKVTLLYLVNKFDILLSGSHITQFALEESLMNYYQAQTYLNDMVEVGYLEQSTNNSSTHFTITGDGIGALDSYVRLISADVKNKIGKFAEANRRAVKKDFDSTANLFFNKDSNEYTVKCGVYEEDMTLMELNLSVVSREQAVAICTNWRENVANLYGEILGLLLKP